MLVDSWLLGGYCVLFIWFLALERRVFWPNPFLQESSSSNTCPLCQLHAFLAPLLNPGPFEKSWNSSTGFSLTELSLAALWLVLPIFGELLTLRSGCCTFPKVFNWAKTLSWSILVYSLSWITWTEAYWWNFTEKIDPYSELQPWYLINSLYSGSHSTWYWSK